MTNRRMKMSEQTIDQSTESALPTEEVATESTPEVTLSEAEQKAMSQGWKPKEEFQGDKSEWRDAQTWLDRGELFGKIEDLKKSIKTLKDQNKTLADFTKVVEEKTRERTINELKSAQKKAVEEGDIEAVEKITNQMIDVKNSPTKAPDLNTQADEDKQIADEFVSRNQWFLNDKDMAAKAIALENAERSINPNLPTKERLERVEQQIKSLYPNKFENSLQSKSSPVVTSTDSALPNSKKTSTYRDLPDFHKSQIKYLESVLGYKIDVDKYISDLKSTGSVK